MFSAHSDNFLLEGNEMTRKILLHKNVYLLRSTKGKTKSTGITIAEMVQKEFNLLFFNVD